MKNVLYCFAIILLLASCWKQKQEEVLGYAPVYGNETEMKTISLTTAQPLNNGGKIYVFNNMLYQVEAGKGIHITDISNPENPVKKGFLKVAGAQELSVKDNLIFTNNMRDLVIVNIENNTATTVRRLQDSFKVLFTAARPPERGKFECPDPLKGNVIGWQKRMIVNPACTY